MKRASGPYWLATNFDPAYLYLINGLHIFKGIPLNDASHPGTPLQLLCCAVCGLFNIGRPMEETVMRVLTNPEFYLRAVFVVLTLFVLITSIGLGWYVFRKTNDKCAALLSQLPLLSFLVMKSWESRQPVLPVMANVDPEPMLVGILNLFNFCILMDFFAQKDRQKDMAMIFWGLVCGFGAAVKLTFLPVIAVPLIVLSWQRKALFTVLFAVSFFIWTIPALSQYPLEWSWISGFLLHGGHFQSSQSGSAVFHNLFLNGQKIVLDYWAFAVLLLTGLGVVFADLCQRKWGKASLFLLAVSAGIVFQAAIVTQNPGAHYLVPGVGLCASLLVLLYLHSPFPANLTRNIAIMLIVTGSAVGVVEAGVYLYRLAGLTQQMQDFEDQVSSKYSRCTVVDYYRSSDQEAALFFGDGYNLAPALGNELFRLYPDRVFLHIWGNRLLNFQGKVWANDLLAQNPCVVFRGDGQFDFDPGPYQVRLLEKGRFESLHLLTATSEKQAAILLAGAYHYLEAGDYTKSYALALQARRFHYQPDASVESLISLVKGTYR
jgi:hypothetical protein